MRLVVNEHGKWVDKQLGNKLYASPSMSAPAAVDEVPVVPIAIPAPCAAIFPMLPQSVPSDPIFPIVTKLKADVWEQALKDVGILNEFIDIPTGLRGGFLCGLEKLSLARTFIAPNHYIHVTRGRRLHC
jgi:hypothetical protein